MFDIEQDIEDHYEEYRRFLVNVIKKRYRESMSLEDIEDLISDIFIRAIRYKENFEYRGENSLKAWLCTLSINEAINRLKSISGKDIYSQEDEGISFELNSLHNSVQNENIEQFYEEVIKYLDSTLPKLEKNLLLGFANGYTYEELSEIFEINLGTIKSKIHHTRKKLLNYFKHTYHDYGWKSSSVRG